MTEAFDFAWPWDPDDELVAAWEAREKRRHSLDSNPPDPESDDGAET